MADSFLDSFTGAAGSLVGRTPDGAGSVYAFDAYNSSGADLTTMLVDGSGNLESESDTLGNYARSTFTRLGPYYTIEAKFTIGSASSSVSLDIYGMDTAGPVNLLDANLVYATVGGLTVDMYLRDLGDNLIYAPSGDSTACPLDVGVEQTLEMIVTPANVKIKVDGTLLLTSSVVPDASIEAISFTLSETKPASPGTVRTSVRVYENEAPPAVSSSFNTPYRPRIFAPG